jgi:hypothetical protein
MSSKDEMSAHAGAFSSVVGILRTHQAGRNCVFVMRGLCTLYSHILPVLNPLRSGHTQG